MAIASPVLADQVSVEPSAEIRLTTLDGKGSVTGTLVLHDAKFYTVETALGRIKILSEHVICTGSGCPADPAPQSVQREEETVAELPI